MEATNKINNEQSTAQRVKRSMFSMLIGRPISALGGLLVLVLLSRLLTKDEYGAYFALWALVEISILLSDPGVLHLIYRFVSASSNDQGQIMPKGPAPRLLISRILGLGLGAGILFLIPAHWLEFFKLASAPHLLQAAAIILLFEGLARTIEAIFDSMLCQGASQITTVSRTIMRLLGIFVCYANTGGLTFDLLIWVDIAATSVGVLLGLCLLLNIYFKRHRYQGQFDQPTPAPIKTLLYYAWPAYLSQTLGIVCSADVLKLTLSGSSGVTELAVFGYVFSLAGVIQRYLPANLLAGVFRPLFIAAAQKPNADRVLVELLIACIKINWLFIVPMVCFSFILGDELLAYISGGKYVHVGSVLTVAIVGLMAFSVHLVLSHLCLARQTPWPLLGANLVATVGIFVGLALSKWLGALGTALAFCLNETIWCAASFYFLFRRAPFLPHADLNGVVRLAGVGIVVAACAYVLKTALLVHPLIVAAILAFPLAIGLCRLGVLSEQEGQWLMTVLPLGHKLPLIFKFRQQFSSAR